MVSSTSKQHQPRLHANAFEVAAQVVFAGMAARSGTLCDCGYRACRRQVQKEGPNKGRYFFGCTQGRNGCGFFSWDTAQEPVQSVVIRRIAGRQHIFEDYDKELATVLQHCLCVGEGSQQSLQRLTQQYPSAVLQVLQKMLELMRPELHSVLAKAYLSFKSPTEAAEQLLAVLKADRLVPPQKEAAATGMKRTAAGLAKVAVESDDPDEWSPIESLFQIELGGDFDKAVEVERLCSCDILDLPSGGQKQQVVVLCERSYTHQFTTQLASITEALKELAIGPYKFGGWLRCVCEDCTEHHGGDGPQLLLHVKHYNPDQDCATVAEPGPLGQGVDEVCAGYKMGGVWAGVFIHVYENTQTFKLCLEVKEATTWSNS